MAKCVCSAPSGNFITSLYNCFMEMHRHSATFAKANVIIATGNQLTHYLRGIVEYFCYVEANVLKCKALLNVDFSVGHEFCGSVITASQRRTTAQESALIKLILCKSHRAFVGFSVTFCCLLNGCISFLQWRFLRKLS